MQIAVKIYVNHIEMLWGFMKIVDIYVNHSRYLCCLYQNSVMASSGHLRKAQWTQKLFMPELLV